MFRTEWPSLPLLWQRGCSWRSLSPPRGSHITNLNRREPPYWQTSPQQPLWLPGNVSGTGTRNISGTGTGNISDTGKELELAASLALAKNWGPKDKQHSVLASSPPLETPGITLERAQIQLPVQQPSGWPGHAHFDSPTCHLFCQLSWQISPPKKPHRGGRPATTRLFPWTTLHSLPSSSCKKPTHRQITKHQQQVTSRSIVGCCNSTSLLLNFEY